MQLIIDAECSLIALAKRPSSAIERSLRLHSLENGHYAEIVRRISAQRAADLSHSPPGDSTPEATSPLTAGFIATLK
jgi:hypothetical protein